MNRYSFCLQTHLLGVKCNVDTIHVRETLHRNTCLSFDKDVIDFISIKCINTNKCRHIVLAPSTGVTLYCKKLYRNYCSHIK